MERYENVFNKSRFHQQWNIFYFLEFFSIFVKIPFVVDDTDEMY